MRIIKMQDPKAKQNPATAINAIPSRQAGDGLMTKDSTGPYLGFFVCGGKLGFREISDQYSYKKQPSKIRHYVRKKTFSFPGGGNCPLRPPAMYGPAALFVDINPISLH